MQSHAGLEWSDSLTPHQLGLAVDELWFPCRAVALAGVMENLDEGALLSRWTSAPLVKRIFKHQVELGTVLEENISQEWTWAKTVALNKPKTFSALHKLRNSDSRGEEGHYFVGVDAVDLPQLIKRPLWPFDEGRRSLELLHLSEGYVGGFFIRHCGNNKSTTSVQDWTKTSSQRIPIGICLCKKHISTFVGFKFTFPPCRLSCASLPASCLHHIFHCLSSTELGHIHSCCALFSLS